MAQKAIYEYDGKKLVTSQLVKFYPEYTFHNKLAVITPTTDLDELEKREPWLKTDKLVVKPDQLFGKRGKANLILLNADFQQVKEFVKKRLCKEVEIHGKKGVLKRFLVEPYVPHKKEYFISITSDDNDDIIHFSKEGGIFVEENWSKVTHIRMPFDVNMQEFDLASHLPQIGKEDLELLVPFIKALYEVYRDQDFTFLEINPLAISEQNELVPLDLKSRLDDTAFFKHYDTWGNPNNPIEFPGGFGKELTPEEEYIAKLDEKTGASLKFTLLNPKGRIWTLLSGGGASVIFTDAIVDLGYGSELANYGEYSGNPSQEHTFIYADQIVKLMCKEPDPEGRPKYLFVGGGIANFTDIAATFRGLIRAFKKQAENMKRNNVHVYVRRGGPNEKEGLKLIKDEVKSLGIPIEVYDRYTPMTRIVKIALKGEEQ